MFDEIEKEFNDDVRDKKRIAQGIHHRASRRRGMRGAVTMTADLLKGKAKQTYINEGKMVVYSMVKTYDDLLKIKDKQLRKSTLIKELEVSGTVVDLASKWGVKPMAIYSQIKSLGIIHGHKHHKTPEEQPQPKPIPPKHTAEDSVIAAVKKVETKAMKQTTSGTMTGEQLMAYCESLEFYINKTDKYMVYINIMKVEGE